MNNSEIIDLTVHELKEKLEKKELTSEEITKAYIDRINEKENIWSVIEKCKLIFTFLDIVERVRPKAFVMENVKALGVLEKWESVRRKYLERVYALGYNCVPFIML